MQNWKSGVSETLQSMMPGPIRLIHSCGVIHRPSYRICPCSFALYPAAVIFRIKANVLESRYGVSRPSCGCATQDANATSGPIFGDFLQRRPNTLLRANVVTLEHCGCCGPKSPLPRFT